MSPSNNSNDNHWSARADEAVYRVGIQKYSIHKLLSHFAEPRYIQNGISRISDLHLKVSEPARFRFDSELLPLDEAQPLEEETLKQLLYPLLKPKQIELLQSDQPTDIDGSYDWPEKQLSFRINTFKDREGLACTIRVLPRTIPALAEIGFSGSENYESLLKLKQGLVIVTGVTGSGKSTTIASLIQHINRTRKQRVITLEDPIEYVLPSDQCMISQRELGQHISTFSSGLRSCLREDPDIIFVGEIRDPETASLALTAAETGHLVLTTLHTRDSKGALTRIVDLFPAERTKELATQLSFGLSRVIAQKLVPRADKKGRRVAMEILVNNNAIANLIRSGQWHQINSTMETAAKDGMMTLEKHLKLLVDQKEITVETAVQYANDPRFVQSMLQ